jgi:hypothetical protein
MDPDHRRRPRRKVLLTARDRQLLELAAEHRLILPAHACALLGVSRAGAATRLRALSAGGYLTSQRLFAGQPTCYQISRNGLEAIGSGLPRPRIDLRGYAHDVGLAWVWLAADAGTFGPMREIVSERAMRSLDGRSASGGQPTGGYHLDGARAVQGPLQGPLGIRLGGLGPGGRERLHYPDLLLVTPDGRRVAVELELSIKARVRLERILAGYGSDPRVDAVLYLVDRPAVARSIQSAARRLGIAQHVHVQWVQQPGVTGLGEPPVRAHTRRSTRPGAVPTMEAQP